jgi:signal transduction histidine kinase
MRRLVPQTLFGQTLIILLLGLAASQLAGAWIYSGARQEAVRAVGAMGAAQRIANLVRLLEDAPVEWRNRILTGSSEPGFRASISVKEPTLVTADEENAPGRVVEAFLRDELPATPPRNLRVRVTLGPGLIHAPSHGPVMRPGMGPGVGFGPMRHWMETARGLDVAVQLSDARWLTVSTLLPESGPALSPRLLLAIAVMAAIAGLVAASAVRRLTTPLSALAAAATRIGRDVRAPPLSETGSIEMRQAAHALNDMQARLRGMIDNRTRMLAAISHDLRTELQLIRLRSETLEPQSEREKLLGTVFSMEALLSASLNFARDETTDEHPRPTEIGALIASIVDDLADAGRPVTFNPHAASVVVSCRPNALRRVLTNLIDNAIKYGERATVTLQSSAAAVEIAIDDEGPGIPETELDRVLQPFYRLEGSRSRDTGGMGLGLAIAKSTADANGYMLRLTNRPERGLRASLELPTHE